MPVNACVNEQCCKHDQCYSRRCVQKQCYWTISTALCDATLMAGCQGCARTDVRTRFVCSAVGVLTGGTTAPPPAECLRPAHCKCLAPGATSTCAQTCNLFANTQWCFQGATLSENCPVSAQQDAVGSEPYAARHAEGYCSNDIGYAYGFELEDTFVNGVGTRYIYGALHYDVSSIPAGSVIVSASLRMSIGSSIYWWTPVPSFVAEWADWSCNNLSNWRGDYNAQPGIPMDYALDHAFNRDLFDLSLQNMTGNIHDGIASFRVGFNAVGDAYAYVWFDDSDPDYSLPLTVCYSAPNDTATLTCRIFPYVEGESNGSEITNAIWDTCELDTSEEPGSVCFGTAEGDDSVCIRSVGTTPCSDLKPCNSEIDCETSSYCLVGSCCFGGPNPGPPGGIGWCFPANEMCS
jgi:hypothetical protein